MGARVAVGMALDVPDIGSQDLPGANHTGKLWHLHGPEPTQIYGAVGRV